MARSNKPQNIGSLHKTLIAAHELALENPQTILISKSINSKLKNVVADFPEYKLSATKLMNIVIDEWLERNRDELIDNHLLKQANRY